MPFFERDDQETNKEPIMLELCYQTWDGNDHRFPLREGVTRIGRTAENTLQIDELALSALHCVIEVSGDRVVVRDADSASGTFVDGVMVNESPLNAGQVLNLGTFSVKVVEPQGSSGPSPHSLSPKPPERLEDGSYSCQTHRSIRAALECDSCFRLYCSECFNPQESASACPQCQKPLIAIDWSGMDRTRNDVVMDLIPEEVKKALDYWKRYQDWERKRDQ